MVDNVTVREAAIKAALEAWRALPEDERNGERPFVMGFNAGWEEALSQQDEGADSDCAICGQPPHKHSGGFPNTCPMIATYRPSRPPAEQVRMREALEEAFTPDMIENVKQAAGLIGIEGGWGHAQADGGLRIAGFYYQNSDAVKANVLPAHCVGAMRDLVLALSAALTPPPKGQNDHG